MHTFVRLLQKMQKLHSEVQMCVCNKAGFRVYNELYSANDIHTLAPIGVSHSKGSVCSTTKLLQMPLCDRHAELL